ncbi:MAG: hypothetical protein KC422_23490 [Trueperaceae bacterium]|nr:hypothetical protein [Trueperaceae bacterium]
MIQRLAFLFLSLVLLAACQQPFSTPLNHSAPVQNEQTMQVIKGEQLIDGQSFPDGRLWLLDLATGEKQMLTRNSDFGRHFFAVAGVLAHDLAYGLINQNNHAYQLYALPLDGSKARFLTDAKSLGLSEIIPESLTLSPDGSTLAFSAYKEEGLESSHYGENFVWRQGVYTLDLSAPESSLKAITEQDPYERPKVYKPYFDSGGNLHLTTS